MTLSEITTVTGPVGVDDLGVVLPHEHVFSNALLEYRATGGLLNDEELAIEELALLRQAGGATLVDLTVDEIGRDPQALKRVSEATGLYIVMGCGHYRDPYLDRDWFDRTSADEIAAGMIGDIVDGVRGTGIRAGVIGEIGADRQYVSAAEERSLRAAARAHHATGVTVSTHAARWPVGLSQLDILLSEGVAPQRVIIGHVDTVPDAWYARALAERGAYVSFDGFGSEPPYEEHRSIRRIAALVEDGYERQILLSQDVFQKTQLHGYGGNGYDYLLRHVVPRMVDSGIPENAVRGMLSRNPRHALSGATA